MNETDDPEIDLTEIMAAITESVTPAINKARTSEFQSVLVSADSDGVSLYSPWLAEIASFDGAELLAFRTIDFPSLLTGITDDINDAACDGVFDNTDDDSYDRRHKFAELRLFASSILNALDEHKA